MPPMRLPWLIENRWHELCFLHWRLPPATIAPLLPRGIQVESFDGSAWIGVVPFHMTGVRPRGIPLPARLSAFSELNVRTYVRAGDRSGIWFLSLDATQPLAVRFGRAVLHLPYLQAGIVRSRRGDTFDYRSERTHLGAGVAELKVTYRPTGPPEATRPGTLEHFLTARDCVFTADSRGRLARIDVAHAPWPLQPAEAEVRRCTLTQPLGIDLPETPPLAHYSDRVDARLWWPTRVRIP